MPSPTVRITASQSSTIGGQPACEPACHSVGDEAPTVRVVELVVQAQAPAQSALVVRAGLLRDPSAPLVVDRHHDLDAVQPGDVVTEPPQQPGGRRRVPVARPVAAS